MKFSSFIKFCTLSICFIAIASCGRSDVNADFNEVIMGEWEVRSIETGGEDIFPTTYSAQSYSFEIDDDFPEQGNLERITALVGATMSTTEEFPYTISGSGGTIGWGTSSKQIAVLDTTMTIFIGTGADQMKVTAVSVE